MQQWLAPLAAFVVALAVYLLTAPPGLTWAHDSADGGDLIAAALAGGVPHPTGYPTFTLLARLFTRLPWQSPAWRVTLLSATGAALAAAFVAAALLEMARLRPLSLAAGGAQPALASARRPADMPFDWTAAALPALAAGLALAFTPLLWGQATVAEVYALQAGLAAVLVWSLARWGRTAQGRWAALAGLVFGLGLGNHLTMIWLAPLAVAWLVEGRKWQGQAWRRAGWSLAGLAAGLLVYAYLPLAAAGNPPVNWGDARTASGFWWLVSGQLYRSFVFAVAGQDALLRLVAWAGLVWRNFLPWGVALALAGLVIAYRRCRWTTLGALASLILGLAWAVGYNTTDSALTLLPGWVLIAVGLGLGLMGLVHWLRTSFPGQGAWLAALVCIGIAVAPLILNWSGQDLSRDRRAEDFIAAAASLTEPGALVVTDGDRATFGLWYLRYGLQRRADLVPVSRDLWPLESYRATVAGAHPQFAAGPLPVEFSGVVQGAVEQGRLVYLAQGSPGPASLSTLGLDEQAPYRLELVAQDASRPGEGWALWRLQPVRP